MRYETVLNLGAGKDILRPIGFPLPHPTDRKIFQVNVDSIYESSEVNDHIDIETMHKKFIDSTMDYSHHNIEFHQIIYNNLNAFDFLNKYKVQFDHIIMYRFMEHISRSNLLYFIYLLSTTVKIGGYLDIIVPDYSLLSKRLLEEVVGGPGWENEDIILTTEFCNEPSMPHASVWTTERAKYYLQLEKRFQVTNIETPYIFDGRDIYMRIIAQRI